MTHKRLVFEVLPDELVLQIIARLPIKSILKFKSVCKLWNRWMSESHFIKLYNQIVRRPGVLIQVSNDSSNSKPNLFFVDSFVGVSEINLDFIKDKVRIRDSSNGLLWCSSIPNKGVHYVCNPMTRQYKVLPRPSDESITNIFYPDGEARFLGLVCGSFNCNFSLLLAGYSWSVDRLIEKVECLVYDSETGKWSKFNELLDDYFIHMNINQDVFKAQYAYVKGSIYWLREGYHYIRFLDLKPDSPGAIALPVKVQTQKGDRAFLSEFDGLLSVVHVSDGSLTIWVLKDKHAQKWETVEKLSSKPIKEMIPYIYRISQYGEFMIFATHEKVVVYNRSTKVWSNLLSEKNGCSLPLWITVHSFRSTLLSLYD